MWATPCLPTGTEAFLPAHSFVLRRPLCPPLCVPCSLHQVHDEEKGFEMELAWVCEESGRQFQRVPQPLAEEAGE